MAERERAQSTDAEPPVAGGLPRRAPAATLETGDLGLPQREPQQHPAGLTPAPIDDAHAAAPAAAVAGLPSRRATQTITQRVIDPDEVDDFFAIDDVPAPPQPRDRPRVQRLTINRAPETTEVQRRLQKQRQQLMVGVVDPAEFAIELAGEFDRRSRGGRNCMVGSIALFEMDSIAGKHGPEVAFDLVSEITLLVQEHLAPIDLVTVAENGEITIMARESRLPSAIKRVEKLCRAIAGHRFDADHRGILLTPSSGVATLDDGADPADVLRRVLDAREVAAGHLDLRVHRWEPAMSADTAPEAREPFTRFGWPTIKERLRAPVQILSTYVLGLFIPFCIYWFMGNIVGFDITWWVYLAVVVTLMLTGAMILTEANLAVKQKEPPEVADEDYPLATAIICAYLPNEASTIMGTLDCFLNQDYPGGIQVILAYNTPNSMAVERDLAKLAEQHENLEVVRVEGSTSKAQNVNAVLGLSRGAFTGMFDADHEPRHGSFQRAWRWLSNGYDVVQGHCMTRNGEETRLARMIAVEFESIYAVAHPGRAKLHRFGVFGGSNGYWKTELLHETRMRGSMLTEDIDSSMRTVERGLKIRSDRDLVSRELATTTFKQVWNQRLRWAQGWFQVTMMHTVRVWRSPGLTFRQKFGASYLLGYREVYPWLSLQVFPLVAYWLTRGDSLSWGWPIFLCTTLFVLHIGPVQTWYAWRLADEEIKQHTSWFWAYLLFSTVFYTEYKNTIARVAHIKEFVGERAWKVTPRSDDPVEFADADELDEIDEIDGGHDNADEAGEPHDDSALADDTDLLAAVVLARRQPLAVEADADVDDAAAFDDRSAPESEAPAATTTDSEPESSRLAQRVAALVPTAGVHGDPLLGAGSKVSTPASRLDETLISQRVRTLVEKPLPTSPPAGEPLLTSSTSRKP